jgi:hypothetical protein
MHMLTIKAVTFTIWKMAYITVFFKKQIKYPCEGHQVKDFYVLKKVLSQGILNMNDLLSCKRYANVWLRSKYFATETQIHDQTKNYMSPNCQFNSEKKIYIHMYRYFYLQNSCKSIKAISDSNIYGLPKYSVSFLWICDYLQQIKAGFIYTSSLVLNFWMILHKILILMYIFTATNQSWVC